MVVKTQHQYQGLRKTTWKGKEFGAIGNDNTCICKIQINATLWSEQQN